MLAAYSLDRRLDDFMRTNNAVLNGKYGANDKLYKQCALLTRVVYDTAIRPDVCDVRKQLKFIFIVIGLFKSECSDGLLTLKREGIALFDAHDGEP